MKKSKIAGLAIFSSIASFFAGWLTAPKSGKETREDIRNTVNVTRKELETKLKKSHSDLMNHIDETATKLKGKRDAGSSAARTKLDEAKQVQVKVKGLISAMRDGQAEDEELELAIKQAKHAIKNLRSYLKPEK